MAELTQKLAYELWERRGKPLWDDQRDWYDACRIVESVMGVASLQVAHGVSNELPSSNASNGIAETLCGPRLLADGTHLYPVELATVPAHGMDGTGAGDVSWHPERGLTFQVESNRKSEFSLAAMFDAIASWSSPEPAAGAIREISREPQLTARVASSGGSVRAYELLATVGRDESSGSIKDTIRGRAAVVTTKIARETELSYWHETVGTCRILIPDVCIYHWSRAETARWTSGDIVRTQNRDSCALSEIPKLTLFSANALSAVGRKAVWLVFDPGLSPLGERDWYMPDECHAVRGLLSFLCGKRLPFLWIDRLIGDAHIQRTYLGTHTIDGLPQAARGSQPVPLCSLEHGGAVVRELAALFARYLEIRQWFDLDWIAGPLWDANSAYLDDRLGLASVSLERFAAAHSAFLEAHPDQRRPRVRFLSREQFTVLRDELTAAVDAFASERGIELDSSASEAVASIIDNAVDSIGKIDPSLFPLDAVEVLRARMKEALEQANASGKLNLDVTKSEIVRRRIDSFAEKTNPDKLVEALEWDGVSVSPSEFDVVKKRNDCLHGRRTLEGAENIADIAAETLRFDTLRTLIHKVVLARLGYRGNFVDYSARPESGPFPTRLLATEFQLG